MERIQFVYTNYHGRVSVRTVKPLYIYFGTTEYHEKPQFLMLAWDYDKKAERTFALAEIELFADPADFLKAQEDSEVEARFTEFLKDNTK